MTENRTWLASVLFLDIVEYSKQPVDQQLSIKQEFKKHIKTATGSLNLDECLQLDTGDGCAICYLGDPEQLYPVAINLRRSFADDENCSFQVRAGLNLGPVKVTDGVGGERNCVGAGINDAQRVMDFADGSQLLVSKSYFDMVSSMSSSYSQQLIAIGAKTDKHDKIHELYSLSSDTASSSLDLEPEVQQRIQKEFARYVGSEKAQSSIVEALAEVSSLADLCVKLAQHLSEDDRYHFNEFSRYYGYSSY